MAVTELDAASNNGVEAIRDLIQRAALGTSGRTKVYIIDEVHMLSSGASNALLKTLEDPPGHVVFVLATTDPHKVLATIRSRTQHYDFHLLPASLLGDHLRQVAADAGLAVADVAIDRAVRKGDGSARDALSALDQIVAAGGEGEDDASVDEIVEGLCDRDTARALGGVATACGAGLDPRSVAAAVAAHLRDGLLSLMAPDLVSLPDVARERVADQARRLGPAALVRALDAVGDAVLLLPNAPDPRVTLEVALVKVTRPDVDSSPSALLERIERLERGSREVTTAIVEATSPLTSARQGAAPAAAAPAAPSDEAPSPQASSAPAGARQALAGASGSGRTGPTAAKAALGAVRKGGPAAADRAGSRRPAAADRTHSEPAPDRTGVAPGAPGAAPAPAARAAGGAGVAPRAPGALRAAPDDPGPAPGGPGAQPDGSGTGSGAATSLPPLGELLTAWSADVVPKLSSVSRGRFSTGRFVEVDGDAAVLALPNDIMRAKCEEKRPELERVLVEHFGRAVPVRLVVDPAVAPTSTGPPPPEPDDHVDLEGLVDAPDDRRTGIDRLTRAFPGAEVVDG
jgi:DNA polymerase-3 subunit gamma/tau